MIEPVDAVYERGVLKLKRGVPLADGTEVQVIVIPLGHRLDAGLAAATLGRIAEQPMEVEDAGFSGTDHDRILYDGQQ